MNESCIEKIKKRKEQGSSADQGANYVNNLLGIDLKFEISLNRRKILKSFETKTASFFFVNH